MLFLEELEFRGFQNNRRSQSWSEYSQVPDRSLALLRSAIRRKAKSSRRANRTFPTLRFRLHPHREHTPKPVSRTTSATCLFDNSLVTNRATSTKYDPGDSPALCASLRKNPLQANLLPQAAAAPKQFPTWRRCPANVAALDS